MPNLDFIYLFIVYFVPKFLQDYSQGGLELLAIERVRELQKVCFLHLSHSKYYKTTSNAFLKQSHGKEI